ncbi:hypothetical protein CTZ27_03425 [Streptomyces griseocarneus]|nr:hypothetical protein CTZ27_03425 [Streptomyces griseocarneus]
MPLRHLAHAFGTDTACLADAVETDARLLVGQGEHGADITTDKRFGNASIIQECWWERCR